MATPESTGGGRERRTGERRSSVSTDGVRTVPEPRMISDGSEMLPPGSLAGAYVIASVLGSGGGGIIYSARHRVLNRDAAVKVLRREMAHSPTMVARFLREATAANKIRHPNIVDIYEFGELLDGRPYYVMELLQGSDLRKLLRVHGRFAPEDVLALFEQVCPALEAAHRAGVVHRDLKASNIVICDGPSGRSVKLVDFGIAKLLHPEPGQQGLTAAGLQLGTSHIMAPEQIRGEPVDERADVYALGVLLYQLLTGQLPFVADQREDITWMHLQLPAPRPSQSAPVPPALDAIVLRCMEKDRERRYANVGSILTDLRRACGKSTVAGEHPTRAVGIHVELRTDAAPDDTTTPELGGETTDEALLEDVFRVLDRAEQALEEAGFSLPLRTSNALLGVRLLADAAEDAETHKALAAADGLARQLASREEAHAGLHVRIAVRVHDVLVQPVDGRLDIVGGPLLSVEQWGLDRGAPDVLLDRTVERIAEGGPAG